MENIDEPQFYSRDSIRKELRRICNIYTNDFELGDISSHFPRQFQTNLYKYGYSNIEHEGLLNPLIFLYEFEGKQFYLTGRSHDFRVVLANPKAIFLKELADDSQVLEAFDKIYSALFAKLFQEHEEYMIQKSFVFTDAHNYQIFKDSQTQLQEWYESIFDVEKGQELANTELKIVSLPWKCIAYDTELAEDIMRRTVRFFYAWREILSNPLPYLDLFEKFYSTGTNESNEKHPSQKVIIGSLFARGVIGKTRYDYFIDGEKVDSALKAEGLLRKKYFQDEEVHIRQYLNPTINNHDSPKNLYRDLNTMLEIKEYCEKQGYTVRDGFLLKINELKSRE